MKRICVLLVLLCSIGYTTTITLEFLESKPKGLARDFYIWQFLSDERTSLQDALKAYDLIFRRTAKLNNLMSAKGKVSELPRNLYCQRLSFEKLKTQDIACIKAGLNIANIPSMPQKNKDFLLKKFQSDPTYRKRIEILSSPQILTAMLQSDAKNFATIYRALRANQRTQILNQTIKPQALKKLADENNQAFNNMLQSILITQDKSYEKFK